MRSPRRVIVRRRRQKKPLSFRHTLLISFAIFILFTIQGFWIVDKGIRPTVMEIANLETQKIATSAINYAIKGTIEKVDMKELIDIEYDSNGNVTTVGFDSHVYNQVVSEAVANVQHYIRMMEKGQLPDLNIEKKHINDLNPEIDIIYQIPLGQATKNTLLAQIGPKIPVKLTAIGDVDVELNEEVKASGINNTWIRVSLDLEVQIQIIIPFATNTEQVVTTIPVGMVYISGKVPTYYGGNGAPIPAVILDEE